MRRGMFALWVLCLGTARVASADPVMLTSGTVFVYGAASSGFGQGSFDVSGTGFAANGFGTAIAPAVGTFNVGSLNLSGMMNVNPSDALDNGTMTTGGQLLAGFPSASVQVIAEPFVVPDAPQGDSETFHTSFTARGLVQLSAHLGDSNPIFSQEVSGRGTMSIEGENIGGGQFLTGGVGLTFSPADTGSPTPEPASLLLLGTGLAAVWQSRRVRQAS